MIWPGLALEMLIARAEFNEIIDELAVLIE